MSSLNQTQLIGHLGADPILRSLPDGTKTATLSIATTDTWKDKTSGEKKEKTEWHRVAAFGALAEIIEKYLKKGAQIYVSGKLRTRKWTDKENIERYTTEIIARDIQMLDKKKATEHQESEAPVSHKEDVPPAPPPVEDDDSSFWK